MLQAPQLTKELRSPPRRVLRQCAPPLRQCVHPGSAAWIRMRRQSGSLGPTPPGCSTCRAAGRGRWTAAPGELDGRAAGEEMGRAEGRQISRGRHAGEQSSSLTGSWLRRQRGTHTKQRVQTTGTAADCECDRPSSKPHLGVFIHVVAHSNVPNFQQPVTAGSHHLGAEQKGARQGWRVSKKQCGVTQEGRRLAVAGEL